MVPLVGPVAVSGLQSDLSELRSDTINLMAVYQKYVHRYQQAELSKHASQLIAIYCQCRRMANAQTFLIVRAIGDDLGRPRTLEKKITLCKWVVSTFETKVTRIPHTISFTQANDCFFFFFQFV